MNGSIFCFAAIVKIWRGIGNRNAVVSCDRKPKVCCNGVDIILSAKNQGRIYWGRIVDDGIGLDVKARCLAEFPVYPVELVGHFDTGFERSIDASKRIYTRQNAFGIFNIRVGIQVVDQGTNIVAITFIISQTKDHAIECTVAWNIVLACCSHQTDNRNGIIIFCGMADDIERINRFPIHPQRGNSCSRKQQTHIIEVDVLVPGFIESNIFYTLF